MQSVWWPIGLTVVTWVVALLIPTPKPRGDYDFSGGIIAILVLIAAVIATLVYWLIWALVT